MGTKNIALPFVASLIIVTGIQTASWAQAPTGYSDPTFTPSTDSNLRIPRVDSGAGGNDLRGPMGGTTSSFSPDPNIAPVTQAPTPYTSPYTDPNQAAAQQPGVAPYKKPKKGVSGVGMAVGGPAKAVKTSAGMTDRATKTVVGGTGKAVKEVFKAVF